MAKKLCRTIFNLSFETLDPTIGLVSNKRWIYQFNVSLQREEYNRFKYHLIDLMEIYHLQSETQQWSFVAGTMFLARIEIIQYIVSHEIHRVYSLLNRVDSIDINWMTIMEQLGKETRGTVNDYQYRLKYRQSLRSDYMVEHAFERIIGHHLWASSLYCDGSLEDICDT